MSEFINLKAANGKFLCAEGGGGHQLVDNRDVADAWERFEVIPVMGSGKVALRVFDGHFWTARDRGWGDGMWGVYADAVTIGEAEKFVMSDQGSGRVAFQASNGKYLCPEWDGDTVAANRDAINDGERIQRFVLGPSTTGQLFIVLTRVDPGTSNAYYAPYNSVFWSQVPSGANTYGVSYSPPQSVQGFPRIRHVDLNGADSGYVEVPVGGVSNAFNAMLVAGDWYLESDWVHPSFSPADVSVLLGFR
jgi:hypothetical protein